MNRILTSIAGSLVVGTMLLAGCSSPAASTQPQATAAPKAAASAGTAATAAPKPAGAPTTAAGASQTKASYPDKGKVINLIVPFAAGGSADTGARLMAPLMEKDLGIPIQIANKPAASTQAGSSELIAAKPDGYTLMMASVPTTIITYLDTARKANYTAKNFQFIATAFTDMSGVAVGADSPLKSYADLVDAAKAKPGAIKVGIVGRLGNGHLSAMQLEQMAGVKFAFVQFDSGANVMNAILGNHIDAAFVGVGNLVSPVKAGQARVLAVLNKTQSNLLPGVKTAEEQGFPGQNRALYYVLVGPAGMPQEAVDVLSQAVKKAAENADVKNRVNQVGMDVLYADSTAAAAQWADAESWAAPLIKLDVTDPK